jgi:two-component system nitrate/nitrite sensor histidine kinase NarX
MPAEVAGNDALAQGIARERRLIGAELHDTVVQSLLHIRLRLALLEDELGAAPAGRAAEYVAEIRDALDGTYADIRKLLTRFRCSMDPRGLIGTLRAVADQHRALTGITFSIDDRAGELALGPELELQVFLIVQELLANISRHALAKSVFLLLERDAQTLRVTVDDDGRGMDEKVACAGHHGMSIMLERTGQIGGQLTFSPRAEGGTRALLVVPLSVAE